MSLPVCPLLSVRNPDANELCLEHDCAWFLPSAKKCAFVYMGFKALMEVQQIQQRQTPPKQPPPQPTR